MKNAMVLAPQRPLAAVVAKRQRGKGREAAEETGAETCERLMYRWDMSQLMTEELVSLASPPSVIFGELSAAFPTTDGKG